MSRISKIKRLVKSKFEEKAPRRIRRVVEAVKKKEPVIRREYEVRRRRGKEHLKRLVTKHFVDPVRSEVERTVKGRRRRRRR